MTALGGRAPRAAFVPLPPHPMKNLLPNPLVALGLAAILGIFAGCGRRETAKSVSAKSVSAKSDSAKNLFNGKDLTGWEGLPSFWSVSDGAITGQTTPENTLKANTFLVYKDAQPANFELNFKFRLTPNNEKKQANSGVQYRSKVLNAETFSVGGYQADIDSTGRYAGMLYEEKGRGILMGPGEKIKVGPTVEDPNTKKKKTEVQKLDGATPPAEILAVYKLGEWNDFKVIANGPHLQHFLNGKLTADVTDGDPTLAPTSGFIALQLHTGPPMTIQFKDIQLKTLP
jgi:hypothetical protein